jgi:hypothetical protein
MGTRGNYSQFSYDIIKPCSFDPVLIIHGRFSIHTSITGMSVLAERASMKALLSATFPVPDTGLTATAARVALSIT